MIKKNILVFIAALSLTCSYTTVSAQVTEVSTSVGIIINPSVRSSVGINNFVIQSGTTYDVNVDFKIFKSPFRFSIRQSKPMSEFIMYTNDPFHILNGSEGSLFGLALKKNISIINKKKHKLDFYSGLAAFYGYYIDPDNASFGSSAIALTEPNFGRRVTIRSEQEVTDYIYLSNSITYSYTFWRKMNLGFYAQYDYGFGGSTDFTLSQEILRSPGLYDVEPINLSIQEVSVLHNFLSFGFSIGVGL
jgi:hypothetical protein